MANMVNIFLFGKQYQVPDDLTIMRAMEYAGYQLVRGCGCRNGFCGACATIYRIKGDRELKTCLACQTKVEDNMYVATLPVFRPLIGMDKDEIMAAAAALGTYSISIVPDQDCCTLFTPRNPATRARLAVRRSRGTEPQRGAHIQPARARGAHTTRPGPVALSCAADPGLVNVDQTKRSTIRFANASSAVFASPLGSGASAATASSAQVRAS